MSDAAEAIADFEEAALEFGESATLERTTSTANKRTGVVSGTPTVVAFQAIPSKPVAVEADEVLTYKFTKVKARITLEPKIGDAVLMAGNRYRVTGVEAVRIQGTTIYYNLLLGPQ